MTVGELIHLLKDLPEDDEVIMEYMNFSFKPIRVVTEVLPTKRIEYICIEMEEV